MSPLQPLPKTVLHEILDWSAGRPAWQRDALRRIVIAGTIDSVDIAELTELCRFAHGLQSPGEATKQSVPLDVSHIPAGAGSGEGVSLVSLGKLRGVNRLPESQILPLGSSPGVTVIYGGNGTGKSSYARVLKKACRSRGSSPVIRPNAFAPSPALSASGQIAFRSNGKQEVVTWTDGTATDPRLSNVFIFDTAAAGHYLEQDGPASFTPFGLDVLPKLSKVCDAVKGTIQQEIDRLETDVAAARKDMSVGPETEVGKLLASLSAATSTASVSVLAGIDETQTQRLNELGDLLRSNPKQKAKETRASAARLRAFGGLLKAAAANLSATEVASVKECMEETRAAIAAAEAFASGSFDSAHLAGTGGDFWRKLWEAAREFSESAAYVGEPFPMTADGAKCPLCQEVLSDKSAARLASLHAFHTDASQKLAKEAAQGLKGIKDRLGLAMPLDGERRKIEVDMAAMSAEEIGRVTDFVAKSDDALRALKANLSKGEWSDIIPPPTSPEAVITALASRLDARAAEEEGADDPVARKKFEAERDGLAAREWLGKSAAEVMAQIARYKRIAALATCQRDASTNAVTAMNTGLTERLVTSAFRARFQEELNGLGLRTIGVELKEVKGTKGQTSFGLRLTPSTSMGVAQIASEGEHRCIALAAFLAELSQAGHRSALVFDDPVSSLDHGHRALIAKRLAVEARERQVIVFTHDSVFLNDLVTEIGKSEAAGTYLHLAWNGAEPGHCYEGLPWDCKSPEDRLDRLEKKRGTIAATWSLQPSEGNVADMRSAYSWLRQTIERSVEKIVFADVVFRYRSYVDLKSLNKAVGFTHEECAEIKRLFKRCCDVTDAHDAAQGQQAAVPSPADLQADIEATRVLISGIRNRQKP